MSDKPEPIFIDGLIVKAPHENAPDFVKGAISINVSSLMSWLSTQSTDWVNADIKVSKAGKWYSQVNTFKPESRQDMTANQNQPPQGSPTPPMDFDDDIPF